MNTVSKSVINANSEYKTHGLVAYILIGIGLFTAIPIIVGAIWAMIKKKGALGTVYHSHLVNATRIFWWSLLWTVIGLILHVIIIGYVILAIVWVWAIYRVVNGFAKIVADEPYPL